MPPTKKKKYTYQPSIKKYDGMHITSLHRYAIKGLSSDSVSKIQLNDGDGTFEDDRRFALLYADEKKEFDEDNPTWLHKENFLCAFTAPELLATLDTEYRVERTNNHNEEDTDIAKRLLTIWDRKLGRSSQPLLGPVDLSCQMGREETSNFFTELCGRKVVCVVAKDDASERSSSRIGKHHTHQFGNTSSGVKNNNGDTRTIHIINENTVKQFSKAVYGEEDVVLSSTRFRPNIIIDNLEPWAEFDLIDQTIEVVPKKNSDSIDPINLLRFRIVSRTVRCAGVGVDPLHLELGVIDIPNLLSKHYPEHGPYLGVYAIVLDNDDKDISRRTISVGDTFRIV